MLLAYFPIQLISDYLREGIYAELLRNHLPNKCNVFLGGFVFDEHGNESKQLDIIVNTDTTPKFRPTPGFSKSFSPIEGTLGIISIKSKLDKKELIDSLEGIASIPSMSTLEGRTSFAIQIKNYENWPLKVIYASDSIDPNTILDHIRDYYNSNPNIPINRRPDIIHVAGKYFINKWQDGMKFLNVTDIEKTPEKGQFILSTKNPDLQGILWTLKTLQEYSVAASHIFFSYGYILDKTLIHSSE